MKIKCWYRGQPDVEIELPMRFGDYFMHICTGYGSDWVKSLLSGLKTVRPDLWDSIPDDKMWSYGEVVDYLIKNEVVYMD